MRSFSRVMNIFERWGNKVCFKLDFKCRELLRIRLEFLFFDISFRFVFLMLGFDVFKKVLLIIFRVKYKIYNLR